MTERYRNQAGLIDIESYQYLDIAIIGVGSIGSFLAMALNKLGFKNLILVDSDTVEEHNIPTQFYQSRDIGLHKTLSLKRYLEGNISSYVGRVKEDNMVNADIVFVCVDSLEQRKIILSSILKSVDKYQVPKLLIDGRMHRLVFEVYTVDLQNKKSVKEYQKTLEQEEFSGACTEKGIIQNIFALVAFMVEQLRKVIENKDYSEKIYSDLEMLKFIAAK